MSTKEKTCRSVYTGSDIFQVNIKHMTNMRTVAAVKRDIMWWMYIMWLLKSNRLTWTHQEVSPQTSPPAGSRFRTSLFRPTSASTNLTHLCLRLRPLSFRLRLLQFGPLPFLLLFFLHIVCRWRAGCCNFTVAVSRCPLPLQSTTLLIHLLWLDHTI